MTEMEMVDQCGLRFLMAVRQHEHLLQYLPFKQRREMEAMGISTAHIIWAFHSDTELELLNSIPCCQRQQENWDELRSYGIAWWLRNNATLRSCIERVAKNVFQRDQNPLDAALFYLALRKKNVLTQLFRRLNDTRMYEFFREDFNEERWRKAAFKNAFVLMSKQRFYHAAAFFLLGDSLKDAVQTLLARIGDLQLAMVVIRLYETDSEKRQELLTELLCREVLGCEPNYIKNLSKIAQKEVTFPQGSRDPFERSMALWNMNEYVLSVETLLEEATSIPIDGEILPETGNGLTMRKGNQQQHVASLPDIFNFYFFLRRHPLVIRRKLADAGIPTSSTEQFLTLIGRIGAKLSSSELQLYFSSAHLALGCSLFPLDVLSRLIEQLDEEERMEQSGLLLENGKLREKLMQRDEIDWSAPMREVEEEKLELIWSDDEEEEEREESSKIERVMQINECPKPTRGKIQIDILAQYLKFLATLNIVKDDELNTLGNGEQEVSDNYLRLELLNWLEKESEVVLRFCNIEDGKILCFDSSESEEQSLGGEETSLTNSNEEISPMDEAFLHDETKSDGESSTGELIGTLTADGQPNISRVVKLVHRENAPIVAFAVNPFQRGHILLSTNRELQELSIERVLYNGRSVLERESLKDNDDYQMVIQGVDSTIGPNIPTQTSQQVMRKRPISNIRCLKSHENLPYYVSGSTDGSIFMWEWGVEQPVFIARTAGQYAKVVKLTFAQTGSRFAAVDGDGMLCLWQAQAGVTSQKPYFSQKCHNKYVSDVCFMGQTSTLLITAGNSTGDQNVLLWDTLMPKSKCNIHVFVGHSDGAQCVAYQANTQSIISGGKHGEICIWDVRQRKLRGTMKAFDNVSSSVKCICLDPNDDLVAAGSNEGDIKIWSTSTSLPQLLHSLPTEHVSRSWFSLRQLVSTSLQGVHQISIDNGRHMFSCGVDNSLKIRTIPIEQ